MKKILFWGSVVLLVAVLVFLVVFLLQGMAELDELSKKGEDLISSDTGKNEEDATTPETPPVIDPVDPSEDEDPFTAVDTSNAASQSIFFPTVGSKDGVVADDLGLIGPSLNQTVTHGLTVWENGAISINKTDVGYFYEVGKLQDDMLVYPHRLYYRLLKNGEWESNVHVVDGTNFVLYLSSSYDNGATREPFQRYDGSFSVSNSHVSFSVAIGLAEDFATDFDGFRLYALME